MRKLKEFQYRKKEDVSVDEIFVSADSYGKVKLAEQRIFWKRGLSWYQTEFRDISRVYRRVEAVDTKMCCGNVNFDIQKLVMVLKDGTELEALIGEGTVREAELLYEKLKELAPELRFGKQ